jgi:hypothetical protein
MLQRVVTGTPKEPTKTEEVKKGSEGPLDNKIPSSNAKKDGDEENQNGSSDVTAWCQLACRFNSDYRADLDDPIDHTFGVSFRVNPIKDVLGGPKKQSMLL